MGLGDFLQGVFETGIAGLPGIINASRDQPITGFPVGGFPAIPGGFPGLNLTAPGLPAAPVGGGLTAAACAGFVPTRSRMRAVRELRAVNPSTNRIESWTHRGSPIVWSGDRAIARSYAKAAGFTLRRRGGTGGRRAPVRRRR